MAQRSWGDRVQSGPIGLQSGSNRTAIRVQSGPIGLQSDRNRAPIGPQSGSYRTAIRVQSDGSYREEKSDVGGEEAVCVSRDEVAAERADGAHLVVGDAVQVRRQCVPPAARLATPPLLSEL